MNRIFAYLFKQLRHSKEEPASDDGESEEENAPGTVILHKSPMRKVVLEAQRTVVKSGPFISPAEADALKVAATAEIPVPRLHSVFNNDGKVGIRMSFIEGKTLEELWSSMSADERQDVAYQLRQILEKMRQLQPPPRYIGCCDGSGVKDTRARFKYDHPPCASEAEFNDYLSSSLFKQTPPLLRASFRGQLRTDHRIVFTHGDLAPRNILIKDGKISGLIDWEESGWYPEYWELIKFFERPASWGWKEYAHILFPEEYSAELVTYTAMSKWRHL